VIRVAWIPGMKRDGRVLERIFFFLEGKHDGSS